MDHFISHPLTKNVSTNTDAVSDDGSLDLTLRVLSSERKIFDDAFLLLCLKAGRIHLSYSTEI